MKTITTTLAILAAVAGSALAQINISLTPSGTSRVYDYFSNAYAEVGLSPQGMYDIDTDAPYGPANPFAATPWNIGSLVLDGTPTLSGLESFNITGATGFDFDTFIDGTLFTVLGDYSTALTGISGSVNLDDGSVTFLTFNAVASFTFNAAPGLPYVGSLTMTSSTFDLLVDDDTVDFGFGPVRQVWDIDGITATTAVPEPTTFGLLALGAGAILLLRKRRHARLA